MSELSSLVSGHSKIFNLITRLLRLITVIVLLFSRPFSLLWLSSEKKNILSGGDPKWRNFIHLILPVTNGEFSFVWKEKMRRRDCIKKRWIETVSGQGLEDTDRMENKFLLFVSPKMWSILSRGCGKKQSFFFCWNYLFFLSAFIFFRKDFRFPSKVIEKGHLTERFVSSFLSHL